MTDIPAKGYPEFIPWEEYVALLKVSSVYSDKLYGDNDSSPHFLVVGIYQKGFIFSNFEFKNPHIMWECWERMRPDRVILHSGYPVSLSVFLQLRYKAELSKNSVMWTMLGVV